MYVFLCPSFHKLSSLFTVLSLEVCLNLYVFIIPFFALSYAKEAFYMFYPATEIASMASQNTEYFPAHVMQFLKYIDNLKNCKRII